MSDRADAHMHLFSPGYVDRLPENCRRTAPDELTLYEALAKRAGIVQSLVIGYEGEAAYRGNSDYLAQIARSRTWIRPTWFVARPHELSVELLDIWQRRRFVGLSIYLSDDSTADSLRNVSDDCWKWIVRNRWIVSVNSTGRRWDAWAGVLERFPDVLLMASHLGLPPAQEKPPSLAAAGELMQPLLALARFPKVHVKVSAFYALARPSHAWPHRAAWPFVECAVERFGTQRLVWGSDFSPSLEHVSFDQTWSVLDEMPFLTADQRGLVAGENLLRLLKQVDEANKV